MLTNSIMVYKWSDIEKAIELVKAFPWERKLKKAEYFSDACDMVKLFESVNETVNHPCACDPWYAEDYRKKAYAGTWTLTELKKARRECELHIKSEIRSLANGCRSGQFECVFNLEV